MVDDCETNNIVLSVPYEPAPKCAAPKEAVAVAELLMFPVVVNFVSVTFPLTTLLAVASVLVNRVEIDALGVVPVNTFVNPPPSPLNLLALTLPVICKLPVYL